MIETLRSGSMLKGMEFIAPVIANNDPLHLQRVQVKIPIIHDGVPNNQLPWCVPEKFDGVGQGGNAGACHVPVVNSLVKVVFKEGDPHQPEYTSAVVTPGTVHPLFLTNYPNRWGVIDPKGNQFYVDMMAGDAYYQHHSGTLLHINNDGSATATVVGPLTSSAPNWTHTGPITVNGNVTINGNEAVNGNVTTSGQTQTGTLKVL